MKDDSISGLLTAELTIDYKIIVWTSHKVHMVIFLLLFSICECYFASDAGSPSNSATAIY